MKDYSAPSKAQAHMFEQAMKVPAGTSGAPPPEVHELWNTLQRGPGAAKERHALRNAIVPRDARCGYICKVDPNSMHRIRDVFEIKQKKGADERG